MPAQRQPLDASAMALMIVLCAAWGFQQVAIKLAAGGVSLVMQAGIRSVIATLLLLGWARFRGIALFGRDGTLGPGLLAGVLFAGEFLFIYWGLAHTTASRMIVFLYMAPALTALGVHLWVPGERLGPLQWAGVALAFVGVAAGFGEGFLSPGRESTMIGDLAGIAAALFWAATTVVIRTTGLARVTATKTLFYQLAVSAATLVPASVLLGEPGVTALTPVVLASLAYQGLLVAFASYLAWFWLLTRYLASRLAVFAFLAPLFGVGFGVALLGDPVSAAFLASVVLVGSGIVLVNAGRR